MPMAIQDDVLITLETRFVNKTIFTYYLIKYSLQGNLREQFQLPDPDIRLVSVRGYGHG